MRQLRDEAEARADPARVAALHLLEKVLVLPVAGAENHELQIRLLHHAVERLLQQIQPLGRHHARDHADQRGLRLLRKVQALLQLGFVLGLAVRVVRRVIGVKVFVRLRIIDMHVDSVQNAGELPAPLLKDVLQPVGEPRVQNLLRIGRAHRRHAVCALHRALDHIDAVAVFQQRYRRLRDAEHILDQLFAVFALILDVMDGEHGFHAAVKLFVGIEDAEIDRDQRRLPVVGMDDVRLEVDVGQHLQRGAGKEREPLRVVVVPVEAVPLEIVLVVDQVHNHAAGVRLEHAAVLPAPRDRDGKAGHELHVFPQLLGDVLVQGHHHPAADQPHPQGLRQRACDLAQAAGGGERCRFACAIQYFHARYPFQCWSAGQTTLPLAMKTG